MPLSPLLLSAFFAGRPASRTFAAGYWELPAASRPPPDYIVTPECVESLEWVLESPPPLHQFEEPPIIVETTHLTGPEVKKQEVVEGPGREWHDNKGDQWTNKFLHGDGK